MNTRFLVQIPQPKHPSTGGSRSAQPPLGDRAAVAGAQGVYPRPFPIQSHGAAGRSPQAQPAKHSKQARPFFRPSPLPPAQNERLKHHVAAPRTGFGAEEAAQGRAGRGRRDAQALQVAPRSAPVRHPAPRALQAQQEPDEEARPRTSRSLRVTSFTRARDAIPARVCVVA